MLIIMLDIDKPREIASKIYSIAEIADNSIRNINHALVKTVAIN